MSGMTIYRRTVLVVIFVVVGAIHFRAQTGAATQPCGQPVEVTKPLMIKAERAEYNVRRVSMLGNIRTNSRKLFRTVGPFINEGDIFSRQKLWGGLKALSRIKGIYPVTQ